jgi:hypothetical protein
MGDFPNSGMLDVFDSPWYAETAKKGFPVYQAALPFPHIAIDNFLPDSHARILANLYPDPAKTPGWTTHANKNVGRHFLGDETKYHPLFRTFAQATASRQFLLFLETLTGIKHLIPDPYYVGGGAMLANRGDHLAMHVDFNWHYGLHCHRRCNALFYLTPDWQPEWGGALLLANDDRTDESSYLPLFNRLIVFNTTEHSWHGQPNKLTCPFGVQRRVFSAFYYTAASPSEAADPHLTKYQMETPYTAGPLKDYQA